jgi:hypothetical protein
MSEVSVAKANATPDSRCASGTAAANAALVATKAASCCWSQESSFGKSLHFSKSVNGTRTWAIFGKNQHENGDILKNG